MKKETIVRRNRLKVYVSGPISNGGTASDEERKLNVKQAVEAGLKLIESGYAPFVPQLTNYMDDGSIAHKTWLDVDFCWVLVADAVLRLPGESMGADMETDYARSYGIPVYQSIEDLIYNPPARGDYRFHELLLKIGKLHDAKSFDYGQDYDPYANVRASSEFGVEPWVGALVRLNDKVQRLKRFAQRGTLANESAQDSMLDVSVYAIIAYILYEESGAASVGGSD